MALVMNKRKLNAIRFISKIDDAVDVEASDRDLYLEDPVANADALKFKKGKEPTIFLLNFELSGKENAAIEDKQSGGLDDERNPKISMGAWSYAVARMTLKDIQYPAGETPIVEFKKEGRGYASERVLDTLSKLGIIGEIFNLFITLRASDAEVKANAKN